MKEQSMNRNYIIAVILVLLVLVVGYFKLGWIKSKFSGKAMSTTTMRSSDGIDIVEDGSTALVTMDGKPIVTQTSLEVEYQQLLKDNPQLEQMLPLMGGKEGLMERLTKALAERAVVRRYVAEQKIDQDSAYQAELARMLNSVRDMLNIKYFNAQHIAPVSDREIKEFYDKNRETMPELLVSRGGIRAAGVKFEKEADAQAFFNKAKTSKSDLQATAKEAGIAADKVQDFKLVNSQSIGIAPLLRDKIIAIQKCPSVELIKLDDKTFWVVKASGKEDTTYREFAQVKEHLKHYLEEKKREEVVGKIMQDLEQQYKVEFKKTAVDNEQMAQAAAQAQPVASQDATQQPQVTVQPVSAV
jgi:hypothetical protein